MASHEGRVQANECGMLVSCCGDRYCAFCAHATFRDFTSIFSPSLSIATPGIFSSIWITLQQMFCPACEPMAMSLVLLRTSPGHIQAWIRVSTTPLEAAVATAIAKHLAHTYGGDLASTGSCHLGRLAGFTNQKPQPRTITSHAPWVRIVEARALLASAAQDLLRCATQVQAQLPNHAMNRLFPGSNESRSPSTGFPRST